METDLSIRSLGACGVDSQLVKKLLHSEDSPDFVEHGAAILLDDRFESVQALERLADAPRLEVAGPRRKIYFDPATTGVGIVTCGGLCPGLNNVIRGITIES